MSRSSLHAPPAGPTRLGYPSAPMLPPSTFKLALKSALLVLTLGFIAALCNNAFLAPPLGPTAYSVVRHPAGTDNQRWHIIVGHGLGLVCGLTAHAVMGAPGSALGDSFTWRHGVAASLAVGSTILASHATRSTHPPILATTLVASLGLLGKDHAALALFGGAVLIAILRPRRGTHTP